MTTSNGTYSVLSPWICRSISAISHWVLLLFRPTPTLANMVLLEFLRQAVDGSTSSGASAIVIETPDLQALFSESMSILGMINNPGIFLEGVDMAFENVEWVLGSTLSTDLPIVGEKLGQAADFIREMRLGFLAELKEKISGDGKLIEVVRNAIFDVLGPSGLDFMLDADGDGSITTTDVLVGWYAKDGALLRDWEVGQSYPIALAATGVLGDLALTAVKAGPEGNGITVTCFTGCRLEQFRRDDSQFRYAHAFRSACLIFHFGHRHLA